MQNNTTSYSGSVQSCPPTQRFDFKTALQPFIDALGQYDEMRTKLLTAGGDLDQVSEISEHLKEPIQIRGPYRPHEVALIHPYQIRLMLGEVCSWTVYLDCRTSKFGLPVYYLCRTRSDYWTASRCILEDLHISPDYRMPDERFIKLMYAGHETSFLRLSQYRQTVSGWAAPGYGDKDAGIDSLLFTMARQIFQSAWHEDQRPGFIVARHFGLEQFRQAIELVYLALSADLCELRSAPREQICRFLEQAYPQPAILAFFNRLPRADASALTAFQRDALPLYQKLSRAFGAYLQTEVTWGSQKTRHPLYKLIFGNIDRQAMVVEQLSGNTKLARAGKKLEAVSAGIISLINEEQPAGTEDTGEVS